MNNKENNKNDSQTLSLSRRDDSRDPFSIFDSFLSDSAWDPFATMMPSLFRGRTLGSVNTVFPKVDVEETDNEIKVTANIPGINAENIDIEVGDDYLSLSGKIEKENTKEDKKGKIYRYEREYGEFRREFALPARVNKDKIIAKAKNGVLTITLPKSEEEKKKKIKVAIE